MSFHIYDFELLKKHKKWLKSLLKILNWPLCLSKKKNALTPRLKTYGNKIKTKFYLLGVPEDGVE